MKKIILVSTILLLLGKFAYSESRSDSAKKMTITTDTIIGKKIALPVLEGYYKDEITEIDLNSYKGKWIILFFILLILLLYVPQS